MLVEEVRARRNKVLASNGSLDADKYLCLSWDFDALREAKGVISFNHITGQPR